MTTLQSTVQLILLITEGQNRGLANAAVMIKRWRIVSARFVVFRKHV